MEGGLTNHGCLGYNLQSHRLLVKGPCRPHTTLGKQPGTRTISADTSHRSSLGISAGASQEPMPADEVSTSCL